MENYRGTIVKESLKNDRILDELEIISSRVTSEASPADQWHLFTVQVYVDDFEKLSQNIKPGWYMHFWNGDLMTIIFENRIFNIRYSDKDTWKDAVEYGLAQGITAEQLDFTQE